MNSPQRLANIAGHGKLLEIFGKGSFPPSALFVGPNGIGKKTLALLLGAWANCDNPQEKDLCGHCPSCIKSLSGNHPDILLFESERTSIPIEAMRRLSREAQYRPFQGRYRFFIVDEAEKLTSEAANSLLKTLEEPPETSHLILVTAFPERLLPTIRSRCQRFQFHPLSSEEIVRFLEENTDLDRRDLRAAFAQGSIGTALSLDLENILGIRDEMLELLDEWLVRPSYRMVFERCEKPSLRNAFKKRDDVRKFLELLKLLCYDLYYFVVETEDRVVNKDKRKNLEALSRNTSLDWVDGFLRLIVQAERDLERNVNPLMCFESLWVEAMCQSES